MLDLKIPFKGTKPIKQETYIPSNLTFVPYERWISGLARLFDQEHQPAFKVKPYGEEIIA